MNSRIAVSSARAAAQNEFRLRVAAADAAHVEAALLKGQDVDHTDIPYAAASAAIVRNAARKSLAVIPGRSDSAPNRKLRRYSG